MCYLGVSYKTTLITFCRIKCIVIAIANRKLRVEQYRTMWQLGTAAAPCAASSVNCPARRRGDDAASDHWAETLPTRCHDSSQLVVRRSD